MRAREKYAPIWSKSKFITPYVLLLLHVLFCHVAFSQAPTYLDTANHLYRVQQSIMASQILTQAERKFTVSMTDNSNLAIRHSAFLVLIMACKRNLFSSQDLTKMLEKKAIFADRLEPELYLLNYESLVEFGSPAAAFGSLEEQQEREWNKIRAAGHPANSLSPDEKLFISKVFSIRNPNDAQYGALLLVTKRGLNAESAKWNKAKVENRVRSSAGNDRKFWEFVLRVFEARNPAAI